MRRAAKERIATAERLRKIERHNDANNGQKVRTIRMADDDEIAAFRRRLAAAQEVKERRRQEEALKAAAAAEAAAAEAAAAADSAEFKPPSDEHSVFVGSLDFSVRKEQLEDYFSPCGKIKRTTIVTDKYTHKPKGFAYIEFEELEGVENALKFDDHLLAGRNIKVCRKRENKPKLGAPRFPRRRWRRT
jgi:polyadenylate-binding protein 2